MKIKLPILFNTDSTSEQEKLDIDFDLRLCEIRPIVFYQINAITSYIENDIEYSQIYSNGMSFYSSLKMKEIEQIIESNSMKIQYN